MAANVTHTLPGPRPKASSVLPDDDSWWTEWLARERAHSGDAGQRVAERRAGDDLEARAAEAEALAARIARALEQARLDVLALEGIARAAAALVGRRVAAAGAGRADGPALRRVRDALRLSQQDVARASGYSRSQVCELERGTRRNAEALRHVAATLARLAAARAGASRAGTPSGVRETP